MPSCTAPGLRARVCDTSRAEWGVRGLGAGGGALARFRCLCEMSFGGLCEVITLTAFWHAFGRIRGPRGAFVWEGVRLLSAKSEHLTVVSCVRRCSQTTRLPCVAEGGSFFATADPAGERSLSETMQRYAFPRVRRACALVVGSRKSLIFNRFLNLLVSMGENDAFRGLRTMVPPSHVGETYFSFLDMIDSATSAGDALVSSF